MRLWSVSAVFLGSGRINYLLVLPAFLATIGIAQANLLSNGDFNTVTDVLDEFGVPTGAVTADDWEAWAWGNGWSNTEIAGWSFDGSYHQATGASGGGGGGVFQTVAATAGQAYNLTVDSGADAWWLPTGTMIMFFLDESDAEVGQASRNTVDPAVYGEDQYDVPHPWENYSLTATAPLGTTKIKVELTANNATGSVGFDNADLSVVPEPASLALLVLGGLMIAGRRRR
jgi:PEP-CTERM motif-containing protein